MATVLRRVLEYMPVSDVQSLLKLAEVPQVERSGNKQELLDRFSQVFDQDLKKTWALLSPLEQLAVAEAIYNNAGIISVAYMKVKYNQDLVLDKDKAPKIRLFLLKDFPIPDDLIQRLKTFVPTPKKGAPLVLEKRPARHHLDRANGDQAGPHESLCRFNGQQMILYDLLSVLSTIKNEPLKINVSGVPSVTVSQKINKMLSASDFFSDGQLIAGAKAKPVRGFAWLVLLKTAALIDYKDDIIKLTKAGEGLFRKSPDVKTIKMIYDAFLSTPFFEEALRIDTMAHTKKRGEWHPGGYFGTEFTRPADRRKTVIDTLVSGMKDSQDFANDGSWNGPWIRMTEFLRYLHVEKPRFRVAEYLGEMTLGKREKLVSRASDRWDCLEGSYVRCLFMEYLAVLGLLEISYGAPVLPGKSAADFLSTYDGLYAFRLTELGAYCLGLTKTEPSTACIELIPEKLFHITPNLEVTAVVDHMIKFDAMMLDNCMDKVNAKTWKLSTPKLLQMVDNKNGALLPFKAFLYERALSAIPKTVEHFFEDIERRTGNIAYTEPASIYSCQDKTLVQLIVHDAKTKPFCSLVGESNLVVPLKTEKAFKAGLKKMGYIIQKQGEL